MMTLKWTAIVVAAVSSTLCVTANVVAGTTPDAEVPAIVNIVTVTATGSATVLAVMAELHHRINGRLTALTDFLVARLEDIDNHTGDRNAGFVEGYLLGHGPDASVVPIGRAPSRRAMSRNDE